MIVPDDANNKTRNKILARLEKSWEQEDASRRLALIEEVIPAAADYANSLNDKSSNKLHPQHLILYTKTLQKKVAAVVEMVGPEVIDSVLASVGIDEKLAKLVKIVNMMDEKFKPEGKPSS